MHSILVAICLLPLATTAWSPAAPQQPQQSRRSWIQDTTAAMGAVAAWNIAVPSASAASDSSTTTADLIAELQIMKSKLEPIEKLLEQNEWEKVRQILKTPPVNKLWNLGDSPNTILKLAKATDNVEFFELKEDVALNLQMTDQLTYDNVFVYYQPGNGKVKVKEPQDTAKKAMALIQQVIEESS
jgi:hypothetical protein